MNILLVSATKQEIEPFLQKAGISLQNAVLSPHVYKNHSLYILITGVGIAQTSFYLGKYLSPKFDLAINVGICGSFNRLIKLGEVLQVNEDYFADLGAEDGEKFLSIDELGLPAAYYVKNENAFVLDKMKQVRGVTVNTTHGDDASIQKLTTRLKADVESMEGAAFFYACNMEKVKSLQLRAVSNYVEKRDRSKWEIALAVKNLNETLSSILSSL